MTRDRALLRAGAALSLLMAGWCGAVPARAECAGWNPLASSGRFAKRLPTPRDLIELVNFGRPDAEPIGGPSPLGVSPDGRFVATVLQRADLATNGYCQALVLIDRTGRTPPRILDRGGDFMITIVVFRGKEYPNGFPRLVAARWSSDGRIIAFLKRVSGVTRVWLATVEGEAARPVTPAGVDVSRWAWSADGRSLLFAVQTGRKAVEAAIDREGLTGWRYDERFDPGTALRPQVTAPLPEETSALDPVNGIVRAASPAETAWLARSDDAPMADRASVGASAWIEPTGTSPLAPRRLAARDNDGRVIACDAAACVGKFLGLWSDGAGAFTVLRTEGWHNRYTALYRWMPGSAPRPLLRTDDLLQGCVPAGATMLCLREGALQPPRLVAIDRATGVQRIIFDPNPGFSTLQLGSVRRLEWTNAIGHQVYGDLVLPPGYRGGRLPTIVVQYDSRGFLRGGTGTEYPIQLLAARGFAVLSIDKPDMAAIDIPGLKSWREVTRANNTDWAERRNTFSAIDVGLDLLVAKGIADPQRLGLTGLSDGGSSVRFALINSKRFAAAITSSCCIDEASDDLIGPAWDSYSQTVGYPPAWPIDTKFWQPYSLALNADRMRTPLLMQLADAETLMALHTFTALKAAGAPIDLYFYPDEFHIKWQPRHRAAVYDRSLDWFSFWLAGREDPTPAKAAQYKAWRALRTGSADR